MKRSYLWIFAMLAAFSFSACAQKEMQSSAGHEQVSQSNQDQSSSAAMANSQGEAVKDVYDNWCAPCHASGVMDAPKTGDKKAWKSLIAQGMETLYDRAINGYKKMPPRGGHPSLSDKQVKDAVDYMVDQSK
ncbi:MAG: c-type cytochrome [Desulfuromonadales bacterium]|jgi:cytochrome c5